MEQHGLPFYNCFTTEEPVINVKGNKITNVVQNALKSLGVVSNKKWSGFEFFGFNKPDVLRNLQQKVITFETSKHQILNSALKVHNRNAGPTHTLTGKHIKRRNELVHELVNFASFNDAACKFSDLDYAC